LAAAADVLDGLNRRTGWERPDGKKGKDGGYGEVGRLKTARIL
jgi:hypothetical protein